MHVYVNAYMHGYVLTLYSIYSIYYNILKYNTSTSGDTHIHTHVRKPYVHVVFEPVQGPYRGVIY